jgi:TRAP-type C4-dicarboxylate transport system permease small subunit
MASKDVSINIFERIYSYIWVIVENITSIVLILMTFVMAAGVFYRYVLHSSLPWASEVARYFLVFIGVVGGAFGLQKGKHVSLDLIYNKLSEKNKKYLDAIKIIVIGYSAYIMVISGFEYKDTIGRGAFTNISLTYPRMAIPIGGMLILIYLLNFMVKKIFINKNHK